jgi:hypothetical protein
MIKTIIELKLRKDREHTGQGVRGALLVYSKKKVQILPIDK